MALLRGHGGWAPYIPMKPFAKLLIASTSSRSSSSATCAACICRDFQHVWSFHPGRGTSEERQQNSSAVPEKLICSSEILLMTYDNSSIIPAIQHITRLLVTDPELSFSKGSRKKTYQKGANNWENCMDLVFQDLGKIKWH